MAVAGTVFSFHRSPRRGMKVCLVFFLIAMVKAFVPRYRYDQLMRLGWKVFLAISLGMVVLVAGVLQFTGWGAGMAQ